MQLRHHNGVFGVHRAVGDPIFLRKRMRRVHDDFVSFLIENGRRFHFHGIVAVTEFGESEATDVVQSINTCGVNDTEC